MRGLFVQNVGAVAPGLRAQDLVESPRRYPPVLKVPSRLTGPFRHQYSNTFPSHRRVKLDPTVFLLSKINVGRFLVQPEPHCLEFPLEDGTVVVDLLLASVQDHENEVRGAGHGNHFLPTPFPVRCAFDDS